MVTVTETTTRTLSTPDDIAAFLEARFARAVEAGPFKPGEAVDIVNRGGLPPDLGAGDVAVVLFNAPGSSHALVELLAVANGAPVMHHMDVAKLAKRAPAGGAGE